jgi:hypothetical protein
MADTDDGQSLMKTLKISDMVIPKVISDQPYIAPGRQLGSDETNAGGSGSETKRSE